MKHRIQLLALWLLMVVPWAVASCCIKTAPQPTPISRTASLAASPPSILIGVYMQPASSFQKWKARGVNTVVTDKTKPDSPAETPALRSAYFKTANDLGMKLIIGVDPAGAANDLTRPGLLAWSLPDEPENWGHVLKRPDGTFDWDATISTYLDQSRAMRLASASTPIFGNFNGGPLLSARESGGDPRNPLIDHYKRFAAGCDWISADFYVRPTGRPTEQLVNYGKVQDRLELIAPGKPHYAVIECANQGLANGVAPTPAEVRAAIWISIIHGAKGIFYFPLKVQGGFVFDNTPADVAASMPVIHAEMVKYQRYILEGQLDQLNAEDAMWTLPSGDTLRVTVKFASTTKLWAVTIVEHKATPPADPEKEALKTENAALKARLKRIDDWRAVYPQ